MPTVNIFYKDLNNEERLQKLAGKLKIYISQELTCKDIKLSPEEVSVRCLKVGGEMIGSVEVEITAHLFKERIEKQDEICLNVANYIKKEEPLIADVKVWLLLTELGHSWKE